jgi:hypothetical protein
MSLISRNTGAIGMAKRFLLVCFFVFFGLAFSSEIKGLRPRASRTDYSVTCFTEDIGVAANLLKTDQVRHLLGPDIDRDYVVVEVGFYSKNRSVFEVKHSDFVLRDHTTRKVVRPADPKAFTPVGGWSVESIIEKMLPQVPTSAAVAGYLYFPVVEPVHSFYELDYTGYGAWLTLPLKP